MKTVKQILQDTLVRYEEGQKELEELLVNVEDNEQSIDRVMTFGRLGYGLCYHIGCLESQENDEIFETWMYTKHKIHTTHLFETWEIHKNYRGVALRIEWMEKQIKLLENENN